MLLLLKILFIIHGGGRRGTTEILLQSFDCDWCMCCHPELGPLVGGGTSQSLGAQLWMSDMRNWKVIRNSLLTITESFYYNVW